MHQEFKNLTGLNVALREYEEGIEPLYMESDLPKSEFCAMYLEWQKYEMSLGEFESLYTQGACSVNLPKGTEDAYELAVFDWRLPWRKVKRTLDLLAKLSAGAGKSLYQEIWYKADESGSVGPADLDKIRGEAGYLYLLDVLDNLDSQGGLVAYGTKAVNW